MGSATYAVMGAKIQDLRNRGGGEQMYLRGGAAVFGDVKMTGLYSTEAKLTDTLYAGSATAKMANVCPVAAGTSNVNLRYADFRVCNERLGIPDDGLGSWLGAERVLCKCKVTIASGAAFLAGKPFMAIASQVHLTEATLAVNGFKVVAILAYDQTLATGVNVADVIFDGVNGFGPN